MLVPPLGGGERINTHATNNLDNYDIRINHMWARILIRHRHESCDHGELEKRVYGTHIGHVCRV